MIKLSDFEITKTIKIWIATWSGLRGTTYHHYKQPTAILYCGSGRRWGGAAKSSGVSQTASQPELQQVDLTIPSSPTPPLPPSYSFPNDRMRSPTRVEVDSSVYLESPDDNSRTRRPSVATKKYRNSLLKYVLLVILANTVTFFIKRKMQGDGVEEILVFLGLCNVALAFLYMVIPMVYLLSLWTWTALTKRPEDQPPGLQVLDFEPCTRIPGRTFNSHPEAPPPPYHIAVNSTPPPSYHSIFSK